MSKVEHPPHYGGADNPYEAIKVIEAWGLGFHLGNAVKYICRAGKKRGRKQSARDAEVEDLRKAMIYLGWRIDQLTVAVDEEEATNVGSRNG